MTQKRIAKEAREAEQSKGRIQSIAELVEKGELYGGMRGLF